MEPEGGVSPARRKVASFSTAFETMAGLACLHTARTAWVLTPSTDWLTLFLLYLGSIKATCARLRSQTGLHEPVRLRLPLVGYWKSAGRLLVHRQGAAGGMGCSLACSLLCSGSGPRLPPVTLPKGLRGVLPAGAARRVRLLIAAHAIHSRGLHPRGARSRVSIQIRPGGLRVR